VDGFAQPLGQATFLLFPILGGNGDWLAGAQPFEQQGIDAFLDLAFLIGPNQLADILANAAVSAFGHTLLHELPYYAAVGSYCQSIANDDRAGQEPRRRVNNQLSRRQAGSDGGCLEP
jgi:hypothetical protein